LLKSQHLKGTLHSGFTHILRNELCKADISALGYDRAFRSSHVSVHLRGVASNGIDKCIVGRPAGFYRRVKSPIVFTHVGQGVAGFGSLRVRPL